MDLQVSRCSSRGFVFLEARSGIGGKASARDDLALGGRQLAQPGFNHLAPFGFLFGGRPADQEAGILFLGARTDENLRDLLRRFRRRGVALHDYEVVISQGCSSSRERWQRLRHGNRSAAAWPTHRIFSPEMANVSKQRQLKF